MTLFNKSKLLVATGLLTMAGAANAGYTFDLTPDDKITFGGYIKADIRHTSGDVGSGAVNNEYWIGAATDQGDMSATDFNVNETRFNAKYVHGDVTGFIEMDFYGGGGNEKLSNSVNPRLRHAFIKYKNVLVGQTWSTFQNTSALAESVSFGGPLNASAFIRQGQVRYTNGALQVALENPFTNGGDNAEDSMPDIIGKYTFKDDWGNVSVSGVLRQLNVTGGGSESAFGYGVAGRIKTTGKNDVRFQIHGGETGRYVGTLAVADIQNGKAEETESYMVAYRHFWNDDMRSNVYYGSTRAKDGNTKRNHMAINLFKNITKQLSYGVELGQFEMDEVSKDSTYVQVSAKYVL